MQYVDKTHFSGTRLCGGGDLISQDQCLHLIQARDLAVRQNQEGQKTKTESVKVNFELKKTTKENQGKELHRTGSKWQMAGWL